MADENVLQLDPTAFGDLISTPKEIEEEETVEEPKNKPEEPKEDPKPEEHEEPKNNKVEEPVTTTSVYKAFAQELLDAGMDIDVETITDKKSLIDAYKSAIDNKFSDEEKRLRKAYDTGVEPSLAQQYEQVIGQLDSLSDKDLDDESDRGKEIRQWLIGNSLKSRGYSDEQIGKKLQKIFEASEDIDEAKEALENLKGTYKATYKKILDDAEAADKANKEQIEKNRNDLHKSITEGSLFGDLEATKATREQIWKNIAETSVQDKEFGRLTPLQKYEKDNKAEFLKIVGTLFTLSDGFKNFDKLVNTKVAKKMNKKVSEFETLLNGNSKINEASNISLMNQSSTTDSFASLADIMRKSN